MEFKELTKKLFFCSVLVFIGPGGGATSAAQLTIGFLVAWFGEVVSAAVAVTCEAPSGDWVHLICARNGDEICDDEGFWVEEGARYALHCSEAEGGISYIATHTGPEMSDGVARCQGWEESGQNAWDHLDYVTSFVCDTPGMIVEVDLSAWAGGGLWMGSHDHPDGGGHMTSTCLAVWEDG